MTRSARTILARFGLVVSVLAFGLLAVVSPAAAEPVVLLGLYPPGGLGFPSVVDTMLDVDTWLAPTGKRANLAGDFMNVEIDPAVTVPAELNGAWNNGYVPFVNLFINRSAAFVAGGALDPAIRAWAHQYALWTNGGQKRAFLAPMEEMNGDWTPYHGDPTAYIAAYRHVRTLFEEELAKANVPSRAVSWVFAPNGWPGPDNSDPSFFAANRFENYYPGSDWVDVVSFSAYNYGACAGNFPWVTWDTYDTAILPYLDRMRAMAPTKPIFIAETAVVDAPVHGVGSKNQWLYDTFTRLAAYPGLRGVVYFNTVNNQINLPGCASVDYRLHLPGTSDWQGFWNAMNDTPNYVYWAPGSPQMQDIVFGREPAQVFRDVPTIHPFRLDAGQFDSAPWIHALAAAGITGGCGDGNYCPDLAVTRSQMAVFLVRGIKGKNYAPPPVGGSRFADVPLDLFTPWIEAFADLGITGGCASDPLRYCPGGPVTRAQMAVFLLRALHGASYTPPPATGIFSDVPLGDFFTPWIEALAQSGITGGCGTSPARFCPGNDVTRLQMAIFLVRAFRLPM